MKLKYNNKEGQTVIFRRGERKEEEKKRSINDKPYHQHRHISHYQETNTTTLKMTQQNIIFEHREALHMQLE
jgi:hypothetical protein